MSQRRKPLVPVETSARLKLRDRVHRVARPLRRHYYQHLRGRPLVARLSPRWRRRLGLDDESALGSRRIEIGSGTRPQPGYIHVDVDPGAWHLEAVAPAWRLPFPDAWAEEIVAVHCLEHVHPRLLLTTLGEWRRVLAPGGTLTIHVPDGPALMARFADSPRETKWALMGAILGMNCGPDVRAADELIWPAEHQVIFDSDLLRSLLEDSGYADVADVTPSVADVHTTAWADVVPRFSLIFKATRDGRVP
jgi:hypothetical protein